MEERKFRGKMDCCDHVVCWFCIQEWSQKTARTCPICQRGFHKCKKTKARRKKVLLAPQNLPSEYYPWHGKMISSRVDVGPKTHISTILLPHKEKGTDPVGERT
jgi:hypothetical protein